MRRATNVHHQPAARMALVLAAALLGLTLSGCTAVIATVQVINADKAVEEARLAGADALAPYEYTLAVRYQQEAAVQAARSQNKRAATLAKTARGHAMVARSKAAGGTRGLRSLDSGAPTPKSDPPAKPGDATPAPAAPITLDPPGAPPAPVPPGDEDPLDGVIPPAPPATPDAQEAEEDFISPDDLWDTP